MSRKPTIKINPLDAQHPLDAVISPRTVSKLAEAPPVVKTKQISARIDYALYERLKLEMIRTSSVQQDVVAEALEAWLDRRSA